MHDIDCRLSNLTRSTAMSVPPQDTPQRPASVQVAKAVLVICMSGGSSSTATYTEARQRPEDKPAAGAPDTEAGPAAAAIVAAAAEWFAVASAASGRDGGGGSRPEPPDEAVGSTHSWQTARSWLSSSSICAQRSLCD
jgi:hypothetical protein